MTVYSHSRIGSYENCPLQYKYHYIDRIKTDRAQSVEAFMGSRVHEALEKHYKELQNSKVNSVDDLVEFYNKIWADQWTDDILIVKKEFTQENYRQTGEKAIRDYYARYAPFEDVNTIGCEIRISIPLDDGNSIAGFIDRLDCNKQGIYEIHDYKTSSHLPTQAEADADRQLALYSIAIRNDYSDCKDVRLIWHYLKFDKDVESHKTPEELETLLESIQEKVNKIEAATEFPANRSSLCDWCEYKEICPEWKDLYSKADDASVFTDVDGPKLVDRYAELKNKQKEIKKELAELDENAIEYAKAKDVTRIFGTDHEISIKTSSGIKLPSKSSDERAAMIQVLKDIGKYAEVAETDINLNTLKKIIKEKKWPEDVLAKLEEFVEKSESTHVSLKKKGN